MTIAAAALLLAVAVQADDPKKCSASARECEQQIRQMLTGRRYLGVQINELNPGLMIKSVLPDGPAARADLRAGDRIIGVNGRLMENAGAREFKQALADVKETGTLFLIIQRRGAYRKVEVRLEPYTKLQVDKIVAAHLAKSHEAGSQQP